MTNIIIPKKVENSRPLCCLFHPPTNDATISFTLKGENTPFRTGKISNRCKEISAFMFRPESLNEKTSEYTKPLKKGDIINVEVIVEKTTKTQKVEIV